jgi:antitoxin VapB
MADIAERRHEIAAKLGALRSLMAARGLDQLHLTTQANTAWVTAGAATFINEATDTAAFSIAVTPERAIALADTIEAPRLREEEQLEQLGFEIAAPPWYQAAAGAVELGTGKRSGQDGPGEGADVSGELERLHAQLYPAEQDRLREVAALAAAAMAEAARAVRPGMSEYEAAAHVAAASRRRGGSAVVVLVGSDERIDHFRHPLPTAKPIERYAMLVLCFRRYGLVAALTRSVHFGALPEELRGAALAVARVDARLILGTQPGRTLADMFALAGEAYATEGFPGAAEEHHQGGSIGYHTREVLARPDAAVPIATGQAFAWNPSLRGAKSEDTTLLTENGPELLTRIMDWPQWTMTVEGRMIARPAILEVEV